MSKNIQKYLNTQFDIIYLPSKGLFYKNKNEHLFVKYLTAKEEMLLTSPSLFEEGLALDMVLQSIILNDNFNSGDLLLGDRDAILLFLRSTSYGDSFPISFKCPNCSVENDLNLHISSFTMKDVEQEPSENGEYEITLPSNEHIVKFKPLTVKDELQLTKLSAKLSKTIDGINIKQHALAKYYLQIVSINGNSDKNFIWNYIRRMSLTDSYELRSYMESVEPGVNKKLPLKCLSCNSEFYEEVSINAGFLGITPEYQTNLLEELFLLTYYHKGGLTRDEAYRMTTSERRWEINRISEEIEKKNKAEEDAYRKAQTKK